MWSQYMKRRIPSLTVPLAAEDSCRPPRAHGVSSRLYPRANRAGKRAVDAETAATATWRAKRTATDRRPRPLTVRRYTWSDLEAEDGGMVASGRRTKDR